MIGWSISDVLIATLLLQAPVGLVFGLSSSYRQQVSSSKGDVSKIKEHILKGAGKHRTFDRLAELGDLFGPRMSGSDALERTIDYIVANMSREGFTVRTEDVTMPKWVRGAESAELLVVNRTIPLSILGLGTSIGTPNGQPLTAQVIVVRSFDELERRRNEVPGKIVVYNQPFTNYSSSGAYRKSGAARASNLGAVAALVRSVTQLSIYSPHTGAQTYGNSTPIPVACITVEDAEMMQRWSNRGKVFSVRLTMGAKNMNSSISRNVIAEIRGSVHPEQTVIFGGHIDSWDVGTGSMDDGGGVMIAWETLSVIKKLGLHPKRTVRVVLWTGEEQGFFGGLDYFDRHFQNEKNNVSLIMESDHGAFKPRGLEFTGSPVAQEIMQEVLNLLDDIGTTELIGNGASSDTKYWVEKGVPGAELYSYNEKYFYFHHSNGDTMTVLNADDLDACTTLWATVIYAVANLDDILPRDSATSLFAQTASIVFAILGSFLLSAN